MVNEKREYCINNKKNALREIRENRMRKNKNHKSHRKLINLWPMQIIEFPFFEQQKEQRL